MQGLYKEIINRNKSKIKTYIDRFEPLSIANIARMINTSYNTAKRKVENGSFTVAEAITIYRTIGFKAKSDFEAFEYLFTEQGD